MMRGWRMGDDEDDGLGLERWGVMRMEDEDGGRWAGG